MTFGWDAAQIESAAVDLARLYLILIRLRESGATAVPLASTGIVAYASEDRDLHGSSKQHSTFAMDGEVIYIDNGEISYCYCGLRNPTKIIELIADTMRTSIISTALGFAYSALSQDIDCSGDVLVYTNEYAKLVSDNCETIHGNLWIGTGTGFSSDVVIEGVKNITGNIDQAACDFGFEDEDQPEGCEDEIDNEKPFNLSLPDLKQIVGDFKLLKGPRFIDHLDVPKLTIVSETITVKAQHIDFRSLERIGGWVLRYGETRSLCLENFEGFVEDAYRGGIIGLHGTSEDNMDGGEGISPNILTNRTISPTSENRWPVLELKVGYQELEGNITVAWDKIRELRVEPITPEYAQVDNFTAPVRLNLGGPDIQSMNITNFTMAGGLEHFTRSENTNVYVRHFEIRSGYQWGEESLHVDFTRVGSLTAFNTSEIERMSTPEAALGWEGYTINLGTGCCANLVLNQTDEDDNVLWYWPKTLTSKLIMDCKSMDDEFREVAEGVPASRSSPVDCRNEQSQENEEEEEDFGLKSVTVNSATLVFASALAIVFGL